MNRFLKMVIAHVAIDLLAERNKLMHIQKFSTPEETEDSL